MPNMPVSVGKGVTLASFENITDTEKNEFEQAFLKSYPEFYRQAMEVEEQAKNLGQNGQKDEETLHLCHGDYNQHNVLFQKKNVILTNFEQMCYGEQMTDLGFFMRKMLEKHNWNTGLGMDIVSTYDRVKKIISHYK